MFFIRFSFTSCQDRKWGKSPPPVDILRAKKLYRDRNSFLLYPIHNEMALDGVGHLGLSCMWFQWSPHMVRGWTCILRPVLWVTSRAVYFIESATEITYLLLTIWINKNFHDNKVKNWQCWYLWEYCPFLKLGRKGSRVTNVRKWGGLVTCRSSRNKLKPWICLCVLIFNST